MSLEGTVEQTTNDFYRRLTRRASLSNKVRSNSGANRNERNERLSALWSSGEIR